MDRLMPQHFVLWAPRDGVGGDFYWLKETKHGYYVAVGDCTGHGVPGAFMTMLSISHLNQIAERCEEGDPAGILYNLNQSIKATLNQQDQSELADDGLDIALCYVGHEQLIFAGGGSSLFVMDQETGLTVYKGNRASLGYRRTADDYPYTSTIISRNEGMTIYMLTDGIVDQSGGEKGFSFGKSRFKQFIEAHAALPLDKQRELFIAKLSEYQGKEDQRDDMTLLAFRPLLQQRFK
ncbi:SpoIIE family protein phosphatase [Paenibacillus hexagrammi]|uniref:Serine/threonine-protein phosphatase n=1 Tax=Paenibacillus hexagrammi TaxID=2908839 RepID=A0ABY3SLS2_9BACL|nr:SpoIIE family protein phosphatase [Paenibacillus sp. YPD9-1]UJF34669.1 serine/threonine-protein phosphatase [Paenibacillus sp. YPD9-1]